MNSHPNFRGYDATKGKAGELGMEPREPKPELLENLSPLTSKDLPNGTPKDWRKYLEQARVYAQSEGLRFALSPHPYQLAKIYGEDFTIVLWNSKVKKTRGRHIKAAFEGGSESWRRDEVMSALRAIVSLAH